MCPQDLFDSFQFLLPMCALHGTAQRFALPASGRDEIALFYWNQLRATQTACLHLAAGTGENAQTPTSRVHAVLGSFSMLTNFSITWNF